MAKRQSADSLTLEKIEERRSEVEAHISEQKAMRGAAIADGKPFESSKLESAEAELAGLIEAEGEFARRERAAAVEMQSARTAEQVRATLEATDAWIASIDAVESAGRQFVECLKAADTKRGDLDVLIAALGLPRSSLLDPLEQDRQRGAALSELLYHRKNQNSFGQMRIRRENYALADRWAKGEAAYVAELHQHLAGEAGAATAEVDA